MDFKNLHYILAIAEYHNITKAAEALYIGQPTLSKYLISLEKELGLKLFQKLGRRYELTYAGQRYVEKATQILRLKEDLDIEMSDILHNDIGILRVAFAPMRASYLLPKILPIFQNQYPNVKIDVIEGNSTENDVRLLNGQVDIAFYSKPSKQNPSIQYQTLAEEELLICACQGHRFEQNSLRSPGSKYPLIDLNLLKNERVLLLDPRQRTRQITDTILLEKKIQLKNTLCISSMQAIIGLVAEGYGVAFLFAPHLDHRIETRAIECYRFGKQRFLCDFVAATRKGSYLPHYAQNFIKITTNLSRY